MSTDPRFLASGTERGQYGHSMGLLHARVGLVYLELCASRGHTCDAYFWANSLPDYKSREGLRGDDIIVLRTHSLIIRTGYSRTTGYTLQDRRPGQEA